MFNTSNNIVDFNTTNNTISNIGTYQENLVSLNCIDKTNNQSISMNTLIELDTTIDGYQNLAFTYKDNTVYLVEYKKAGSTNEIYLLNNSAAKQLLYRYNTNTSTKIQKTIPNTWTYLSLAISKALCTSDYQSASVDTCDQEHTLSSVFENNVTILKYRDGWTYWNSNSNTESFNTNRFGGITPQEGLLIKNNTTNSITLDLPYKIFDKISVKHLSIYNKGWVLVNDRFMSNVNDINTHVNSQNKSLKYILQYDNSKWSVYAPTNNSKVDKSLPRISEVNKDSSFWMYVE